MTEKTPKPLLTGKCGRRSLNAKILGDSPSFRLFHEPVLFARRQIPGATVQKSRHIQSNDPMCNLDNKELLPLGVDHLHAGVDEARSWDLQDLAQVPVTWK